MGSLLWVVITRHGWPEVLSWEARLQLFETRLSSAVFIFTGAQNSGALCLAGTASCYFGINN